MKVKFITPGSKKFILRCLILLLCTSNAVIAKPVQKTVVPVPKDSLIRNVAAALKDVMLAAVNPKIGRQKITGRFLYNQNGVSFFESQYQLAGSEKTVVEKYYTDRVKGMTEWKWEATIVSAAKNELLPSIQQVAKRIDSLIGTLAKPVGVNEKYSLSQVVTHLYMDNSGTTKNPGKDSLVLELFFYRPVESTPENYADSLKRNYWPQLIVPATAGEASHNMSLELENEKVPETQLTELYAKLIPQIAVVNDTAAFTALLNIWDQRVMDAVVPKLDAPLKATINKLATAVVEKYDAEYHWNSQGSYVQPPPMPVEGKQVMTAANSSPCEASWGLYKTNEALLSREAFTKEARVVSYDCLNNKYLVEIRVHIPAKNTFFKTNQSVSHYELSTRVYAAETMQYNFTKENKSWEVCSRCHGNGVVAQQGSTQPRYGYQRIGNTDYYGLTDLSVKWEYLDKCPVCFGAGWQ